MTAARVAGTAELAAQALREEIVEGKLTWGSPLREPALCESLGVSRNTLREGLRLLGNAGLVEFGLYRGARVRVLTEDDVDDIYIVRRTLELRSLEFARASLDQLHDMSAILDRADALAETGDWMSVTTQGLRFHQAIVALLGSQQLDQLFANVVAQLRLIFAQAPQADRFESAWMPRDREIHSLLVSGRRTDAVRALAVYLDDSEREVLDLLRAHHHDHAVQADPS